MSFCVTIYITQRICDKERICCVTVNSAYSWHTGVSYIEVEGTKSNWNKLCYGWHVQEAVSSFFEDVFHIGTGASNIVDIQQSKWVYSCV